MEYTPVSNKLLSVPLENMFQIKELFKFVTFKPKVYVYLETSDYILKTATNFKELGEAFKLRYDCFLKKIDNNPLRISLDIDEYDFKCDHLLILNKKKKKVIGTYRLRSTRFVKDFYSEGEFHLNHFLNQPGHKVELGRACVHEDYRNGSTINLLWRGIAEYMKITNSEYMFGCSSIYSEDPKEISALIAYLKKKNFYANPYNIDTQLDFHMEIDEKIELTEELEERAKEIFPGLIKSYMMAGGKIHGYPAHDKDFQCVDLFTILHLDDLSPAFRRKYFSWSAS